MANVEMFCILYFFMEQNYKLQFADIMMRGFIFDYGERSKTQNTRSTTLHKTQMHLNGKYSCTFIIHYELSENEL